MTAGGPPRARSPKTALPAPVRAGPAHPSAWTRPPRLAPAARNRPPRAPGRPSRPASARR